MTEQSPVFDGMIVEFDVPITVDDGTVLRADVFRPVADGQYPVLLSYGPYAKDLHFEDGYPDAWRMMCEQHPDVPAGSTNKYQAWEVADPEKWVAQDYVCIRVDSRGAGQSPGVIESFSPREVKDAYDCIEWAGVQPCRPASRDEWYLLLRGHAVAGRCAATPASRGDRRVGGMHESSGILTTTSSSRTVEPT